MSVKVSPYQHEYRCKYKIFLGIKTLTEGYQHHEPWLIKRVKNNQIKCSDSILWEKLKIYDLKGRLILKTFTKYS